MHEISIINILIYQKLGVFRPVQQKIKLPSPNLYCGNIGPFFFSQSSINIQILSVTSF